MAADEVFLLGQPASRRIESNDSKAAVAICVLAAIGWWIIAYFGISPRFSFFSLWWRRDLLASAPTILISLFVPSRIRGLAVCTAIWWVVAHLVHDFIFNHYYDDVYLSFSGALLLWILTWLPGFTAGVAVIAAFILPPFYVASEFILAFREIFGLRRWEAIKALLTNVFGLQLPYSIIEDGKETITKPKGLLSKIGGPGLVIVRPGNAVVFERRGEITQIVGPGTTKTKLFEFKKAIVQLRPRWITFSADDVMTKDGIALKISGGVSAQIEPAQRTLELIQQAARDRRRYRWAWRNARRQDLLPGDFPVYKDTIFRAVYLPAGEDWEQTLKGAALSTVRKMVGKRRLEDIFGDPDQGIPAETDCIVSVLEKEVKEDLDRWIHEWGVQINGVSISTLIPPDEVQITVRTRWKVAAERASIEQIGEAEASALRVLEATKRGSFDEMTRALYDAMRRLSQIGGDETSRRFQETLQTIAINLGRDNISTIRYIEALEKLANHPNVHVVIAPSSQSINLEQREGIERRSPD